MTTQTPTPPTPEHPNDGEQPIVKDADAMRRATVEREVNDDPHVKRNDI